MPSIEPERLSLDQAAIEAKVMSSLVGEKRTTQEYQHAQQQIIKEQTQEDLKVKEWQGVFEDAITRIDSRESLSQQYSSTQYQLEKSKDGLSISSKKMEQLEQIHKLLESTRTELSEGKPVLNAKLYGDTFDMRLSSVTEDDTERELQSFIIDKLINANTAKVETITLTNDERDFLVRVLPKVQEKTALDISETLDRINSYTAEIINTKEKLLALRDQLYESEIKLETTLSILDELEMSSDAPKYADTNAPAAEQHQSILDRISWRETRLRKLGLKNQLNQGKMFGSKWSLFACINDEYFLLNKGCIWDDTRSISLLTYRFPGKTIALYSNALYQDRPTKINLQGIIKNCVLQDMSREERDQYAETHLQPQFSNLKAQIR